MIENKKYMNKRTGVPLIITCPVCGFTFKLLDSTNGQKRKTCPICKCYLFEYSKLNLEKFHDIYKIG